MNEEQVKQMETALAGVISKELEGVKGDLGTLVNEKMTAFLAENGLDLKEIAKGNIPAAFSGEKQTKYEKIGAFMKHVFKKEFAELKALSEGTDSEGGFLVPEEFHNEIMRIQEDYGLVAKLASRFPMKNDKLNIPTGATSVSVSWPGEANAITASTPSFGNAELNAKTVAGITLMSNEFLADTNVRVTEYLLDLFAEEIAGAIDYQAFRGTGSPFQGILDNASVNLVTMASGKTAFSNVDLGELRNLVAEVKTSVLPSCAFFMHREIWNLVQKLQESSQTVAAFQQNPINVAVDPAKLQGLQPHGYLWGYPVYLSDKLIPAASSAISTKFIVFGSMKKGLFFGDRQQTSVMTSAEGTVNSVSLFETNQSAVRVTQRVSVKIGLPDAFAVLRTAAS